MTHVGEENKENQTQDKDEKEGGGSATLEDDSTLGHLELALI